MLPRFFAQVVLDLGVLPQLQALLHHAKNNIRKVRAIASLCPNLPLGHVDEVEEIAEIGNDNPKYYNRTLGSFSLSAIPFPRLKKQHP